jgi:hypothetical protein
MDNQVLVQFITTTIASGSGAVLLPVLNFIAKWRAEDDNPLSPKEKRRLSIALCVVVPTLLYVLLCVIMGGYDWTLNLLAVGLAYIANQGTHGEIELK